MRKRIAILGSTGSIGTQALEVIAEHPGQFELEAISGLNNAKLLIKQALHFKPNTVVIANKSLYNEVQDALKHEEIKVFAGYESLSDIIEFESIDMVLIALVGIAGLEPTIRAIENGKQIALANKETLVVAGSIIKTLCLQNQTLLVPVDSEHSAIFQCLMGEQNNQIEKIYLTASGGPFRGQTWEYLKNVKKEEALKHPNWHMGCKITIDSASLMNKGLEVIEAQWLFDLKPEQIDVVIHPQSIIHSMIQFHDGTLKAQMGLPDMKLPIQFAFSFPERLPTTYPRFSFSDYPALTFETPDLKNFRNLALAYEALRKGGNMPCVLNAANEVVVALFLKDKIKFTDMPVIIEKCLEVMPHIANPSYEDLVRTDNETRLKATELINKTFDLR